MHDKTIELHEETTLIDGVKCFWSNKEWHIICKKFIHFVSTLCAKILI